MTTPIDEQTWQRLIDEAAMVRGRAYAPYSGFQVGASLLTSDGEIISGCNVENATFGATVCAERNAISAAVARGVREFAALCVITPADRPVAPCGICRQVLAEFSGDLPILMITTAGDRLHVELSELLPHRFGPSDLET